jgi:thiol-disulfide isomerase/thioredoxin
MKKIYLVFIILFASCTIEKPIHFSKAALSDTVYSLNNTVFTIEEMLQKYKGKKVLIDVWASWCGDCIKGLPSVRNLQKEYSEGVFLFFSVD